MLIFTIQKFRQVFPFFALLTSEEIEQLQSSKIEVCYNIGETICKQGAFASHIMLVKSGKAKLVHESKIRNLILKIVMPGEFLQLPSLFEENLFRFSVVSIESTTIWHIEKSVITNIIRKNPDFAIEIIRIINKNKLSIIDRFTSLTQKQAHGKMADLILYLSEHIYKSLNFQMTLSRKDIAELTGMSTETVVRILTEFNNDGLIKMNGKKVELNSLTLLKRLSEVG